MSSQKVQASLSPFLYLNKKGLTTVSDSQKYNNAQWNLYKKEGWKAIYGVLLCKLYDLSSFPINKDKRLYIYFSVLFVFGSISYYRQSEYLVNMLQNLDKKYAAQYNRHVKNTGYEDVA